VADWDDLLSFVRVRYEIMRQRDGELFFRLPTTGERAQTVAVRLVTGEDGHPWAQITSAVGHLHELDLGRALGMAAAPVTGGIVAVEGLVLFRHAPLCDNPQWRKTFDDFVQRFFGNLNRRGGFQLRWLRWIGRPTHIWVQPQGSFYKGEAPVVRLEVWRTLVLHHEGALHRLERRLVRSVDIQGAPK